MTDISNTITQTGNSFWSQNGAQINRMERVFVGDARASDGAWPNVALDWLSQHAATYGGIGILVSQLAALSSNGNAAGTFASRTSDATSPESCIAIAVAAVNDASGANGKVAYGSYYEAHHHAGAALSFCSEMDVINYDTAHGNTPYAMASGGSSICQWLASGGGNPAAHDATLALGIINNGAKFKTGIMFGKDALTGCDGSTGNGEAIAMAKGHYLSWYGPTGAQLATIIGACSTASMQIVLGDSGISLTHAGQQAAQTRAAATGETALLLAVNRSGTVATTVVKLGATNSGGIGKRALVVDN